MPAPATTGRLCTTIQEMKIGDYIGITRDDTLPSGWKFGVGTAEIPLTGNVNTYVNGQFYYAIKVDKGLLISDRVIINSISWDSLNASKVIQGTLLTIDGVNFIYRSLTGGVAYADVNGNKATTDQGYGAWPPNNEWDKYIVNFPQELIQPGKTLDDIFHRPSAVTWCQDTPLATTQRYDGLTFTSTARIGRLFNSSLNNRHLDIIASSNAPSNWGFRPVFEYKEV